MVVRNHTLPATGKVANISRPFAMRWAHWPLVLSISTLSGGSAIAGCGYTGFCGTIAFLGWTADRSKAVFLSQTVQPGGYVVQPTEGITTNIDAWDTTGPTQRISVSPKATMWGGTHILYSVNGGLAFVDSATQSPNGQVFPNNYRSPDSIPSPAVTQVTIQAAASATVTTYNPPQPPVTAKQDEVVVAVQEVKQDVPKLQLEDSTPKPVAVPNAMARPVVVLAEPPKVTSERSPSVAAVPIPPSVQTVTQGKNPPLLVPPLPSSAISGKPTSNVPSVTQAPTAKVTITGTPTLLVEKQNNPGAVQVPQPVQAVPQAITPSPVQVPPIPTTQVASIATGQTSGSTSVVSPPQIPPAKVTITGTPTLLVEKQNNPGAVQVPQPVQVVQQPITPTPVQAPSIPTTQVASITPGTTSRPTPVVSPPQISPPAKVTITGTPTLLVEKHNNPGAVQAPQPVQVVQQAITPTPVQVPSMPTTQISSVTPGTTSGPTPVVSPPQIPPTNVTGIGTGIGIGIGIGTGTGTGTPTVPVDKQNFPGAMQAPQAVQVVQQPITPPPVQVPTMPTTQLVSVDSGNNTGEQKPGDLPLQPLLQTATGPTQVSTGARPPNGHLLSPCLGLPDTVGCPRNATEGPAFAAWVDLRQQSIEDSRGGTNMSSRRKYRTAGLETLEQNRWAFGVSVGQEVETGTLFNGNIHFETSQNAINPYLSYRFAPAWQAVAGLGYKNERTKVELLSIRGAYEADHYSALVGSMGHFDLGSQWLAPSFFFSRNQVNARQGSITGVVGNSPVDVVTDPTSQSTEAFAAALEWGRFISPFNGPRISIHAKMTMTYDLPSSGDRPWVADLRVGGKAFLDRMTSLEMGYARLGLGRSGVDINELRIALVHGF